MASSVPSIRVRVVRDAPIGNGDYVLYWMIAARRRRSNFALQRAAEIASDRRLGLIIFEPLRIDYRWACDRFHAFVIDGMIANQAAFGGSGARYVPYLEPSPGAGKGALGALASAAACVITDDFPAFFLPNMVAAAARAVAVRIEAIDGSGLYPIADTDRVFTTAASFRRHLHKTLPPHLAEFPMQDALKATRLASCALPEAFKPEWRTDDLAARRADLRTLPIDHGIGPLALQGGEAAARAHLARFVDERLARYGDDRNHPDRDAASGLSPYLHFGHISAHDVFRAVVATDDWSPERLALKATGKRTGWWGASASVESFLDELVTWREIGFNMAAKEPRCAEYETLPEWARQTLADHRDDSRAQIYSLEQFAAADTHDPVWNAAQRQLLRDGVVHNYLRMLWGKKILEWSPSPEAARATMFELNNRYAIDGRDPNSISGIMWVLGRYDRAWGPERAIYGKTRYMTSAQAQKKLKMSDYLERYGS